MATVRDKPFDLGEACIRAAREVIADRGVEGLSMRDVARKLGISHQAPYRHFASRDHLLAEIMRRCFVDFARHLDRRTQHADRGADLEAMGNSYLSFAERNPLEYRLMFGTPWPEPAEHPELVKVALHAFDILRNNLRAMHGGLPQHRARADLDALFVWSALHGMASITHADVMRHLVLAPGVMRAFKNDLMGKIGTALSAPAKAAKLPSKAKR